jgi:Uncharacterized anaerobic dehydrogenase
MTTARITVDGGELDVAAGITLTAALVGAGTWDLRTHPVSGEPRGPFCGMGICFECELSVDGVPATRACLVRVRDGMQVITHG